MSGRIRCAIAGYGYIANAHAKAIAACPDTELVAIVGRDESKRRAFAAQYGAAHAVADSAELAALDGVDAVVIALPNSLHAPVAIEQMQAGRHVLVEKPMAMNAAQAREMAAVARATGRRLLVGHQWRFDREARWLRAHVDAGDLGEVVKTKGYGIHVNWGPSGWFVDPALAGGGALVDMGVHAIDTVRYLLGDPEPVSVYARLGTHFGSYAVDDLGVVVIEWEGGAVSIVESGWWNPWMDGPEASTQLFGTRGYGRLFPTGLTRVEDWKPKAETVSFEARADHCDQHTYDGQVAEWARAILEDREPEPGPEHGLTVMRICDAAYLSAREGRVVAP
ncbi:MAG: Gfo/Idh/MocA family oxidoreductase [Deltaproteobacteria bacterium]|nr:Gfo/Idh/MocA family oxidoreductase [Deltaproteobacteria bacterium]MCB9786267.1 Gfo/Idh/MocA family oxidoreductase [Deltaproteobacteria bacterium]